MGNEAVWLTQAQMVELFQSRKANISGHIRHVFDQGEGEWVMVVAGRATLEFADGSICALSAGDYLNIPAHCRHKVAWTDPDQTTIWLAVWYREGNIVTGGAGG